MNGLRKFEVKYSGDPELQPICSFENPALVRLFYKLSTHLNEKVVEVFSFKTSNSLHSLWSYAEIIIDSSHNDNFVMNILIWLVYLYPFCWSFASIFETIGIWLSITY